MMSMIHLASNTGAALHAHCETLSIVGSFTLGVGVPAMNPNTSPVFAFTHICCRLLREWVGHREREESNAVARCIAGTAKRLAEERER